MQDELEAQVANNLRPNPRYASVVTEMSHNSNKTLQCNKCISEVFHPSIFV